MPEPIGSLGGQKMSFDYGVDQPAYESVPQANPQRYTHLQSVGVKAKPAFSSM